MIKIVAGVNPETQHFCISITSPLLIKYYNNFIGMLKEDKLCPRDLEIYREKNDTVHLQYPLPPGAMQGQVDGNKVLVHKESTEGMENILKFVNRFVEAALKNILKKTEFLPILDFSGGYSFQEMQKDVVTALEKKRDFLLIDTYKNYLDNEKTRKYEFNQYPIKYGTDEYINVFILIKSGKLKELRKEYKDKLKMTNWF